jgi:hypothetical protein
VSCATARALSAPGPSAPCHARDAHGRGPRPMTGQASSGPRCPDLFDAMAGPWQTDRALCAWAELGFGTEAI